MKGIILFNIKLTAITLFLASVLSSSLATAQSSYEFYPGNYYAWEQAIPDCPSPDMQPQTDQFGNVQSVTLRCAAGRFDFNCRNHSCQTRDGNTLRFWSG